MIFTCCVCLSCSKARALAKASAAVHSTEQQRQQLAGQEQKLIQQKTELQLRLAQQQQLLASQLKSGAPTYGHMYELYVIAAVVVGGTSLAGGEGKITGTLIGALILAVIQNGMNLPGFF